MEVSPCKFYHKSYAWKEIVYEYQSNGPSLQHIVLILCPMNHQNPSFMYPYNGHVNNDCGI